jgi:AcrR family transcriptional regulator
MRPRGRRPGETRTREAILDAARGSFAAAGFDRTTIRAVARTAGVDPALVLHWFGSKEELFAAAIDFPFDAEPRIETLLEGGRDRLGEGMARLFFDIWEDPVTGPVMVGLFRSAASYEAAAERVRELLDARILRPLATALDPPDAELRADLASAQLVGVGFARHVLRLEPIASTDPEVLIRALAPTIQRYLRGDLT